MTTQSTDPADLVTSTDAWHRDRIENLTADDGWLTLVALAWLEPGENTVGRAASCAVQADGFSADAIGTIALIDDQLTFAPAPGVVIDGLPADGVIASDADGAPTMMSNGRCAFHILRRGERYAVRIKDPDAPGRHTFRGVDRFDVSAVWSIEASFVAMEPDDIPVQLVIGIEEDMTAVGRATFSYEGHDCDVVLFDASAPATYFLVFGDQTNGALTYGGGRFLVAERIEGTERLRLDFNRAFNPPCSFTPFATCPLPVASNQLPFAVTAGEKSVTHHD